MIRPVTDVLTSGAWTGQRAFVIGGGPSLRGFAWERLRGERVVAVNRGYEGAPWADVLFTMDLRFLTWFRSRLGSFEGPLVFHREHGQELEERLLADLARDVFVLERLGEHDLGEDLQEGLGHGANSGYGAAALAYALGARPVYLLGFDLEPDEAGMQAWWHNGYRANDASAYPRFRRSFEELARQVPEGSILNASPTSSIRGFPKVTTWPNRVRDWPLFVSYATDEYYREQAARLRRSLEALGLDVDVVNVKDRGSWVLNCAAKAEVVLQALEENRTRNVVFLDADAEVVALPTLFRELEGDVAAHLRSGSELLSGTLFFRNVPKVRELVRRWIELGRVKPAEWDQKTLELALAEGRRAGLAFEQLPPAYTFIFDTMARQHPDVDPVILHHQASRVVKAAEREGRRHGTDAPRAAPDVRTRADHGGPRRRGRGETEIPASSRPDPAQIRDDPSRPGEAGPERALPVRVGEEVQAVPRRAAVRRVGEVEIPTPDACPVDPYATHQAALVLGASLALEHEPERPWAELGCGWYSTPLLAALGGPERLTVHSADRDWSNQFAKLVRVRRVEDWTAFRLTGPRHGLAFLDNEQLVKDRLELLPKLLDAAAFVVFHDWREDLDEKALGGAHRFVYQRLGRPWTLIASRGFAPLEDEARRRLGS